MRTNIAILDYRFGMSFSILDARDFVVLISFLIWDFLICMFEHMMVAL